MFRKRNSSYRQIIEALTERPLTLGELQKAIGKAKSGVLSAHVEDLEKCGFMMRHHTWNPHNGRPSSQYKIRISDNYVRFYLKAIRPHAQAIQSGVNSLPSNLSGMLGLQLENLVLRNRRLLWSALRIDPAKIVRSGPYFQNSTTQHRGCQTDCLIQTRHSLFVVEVKLTGAPVGVEVVDEVRAKVDSLIKPKRLSVRPVLVHISGVTESLEAAGYFDRIIDFGSLAEDS